MYRFLITAFFGVAIALVSYQHMQNPIENYLFSVFGLFISVYFTLVSLVGFVVSRSIKNRLQAG